MTKRTLPQHVDRCQKLVLDQLLEVATPLTAAQIGNAVRASHAFKAMEIRGALQALEETGHIASDLSPGARTIVFFIAGRPPSCCIVVPAIVAPPMGMRARTWFADLGVAA